MSRLTDFLSGEGVDAAGRSHTQVLALDDEALESRHDFIQWLFPLPEPSSAVPGSPVLTPADTADLQADAKAQERLQRASDRMLSFYGNTADWRAPIDHNHLRITRIIRSLRLLSGDVLADAFRAEILRLLGEPAPVSRRTLDYWLDA